MVTLSEHVLVDLCELDQLAADVTRMGVHVAFLEWPYTQLDRCVECVVSEWVGGPHQSLMEIVWANSVREFSAPVCSRACAVDAIEAAVSRGARWIQVRALTEPGAVAA